MTSSLVTIGVVVPCRNEVHWVSDVLDALAAQDRRPDDVVVVDDGSSDGTRAVVERWSAARPDLPLRVIPGAARGVAAAVNAGIATLTTDVIVRLDGHCRPASDYVRRTTALATEPGVGVAGGAWTIEPGAATLQARAIAIAVEHPLGSGGAAYRRAPREATGHGPQATGGPAARSLQPAACSVDTVPFGCFRRALWEELGGLDEGLRSNEDYDFNFRVRRRGLRVMLDPTVRCTYYARPTLSLLARQYGRYGWWKARMLVRHPTSVRGRQLFPALLIPGLLVCALGMMVRPAAIWPFLLAAYPGLVLVGAVHAGVSRRTPSAIIWIVAAFFVVQMMWSAGFWGSMLAPGPKGPGLRADEST